MTNNEIRMQIALGLITPETIGPFLIWGLTDADLLHQLAEIFYTKLLESKRMNYDYPIFTYKREETIHTHFLSNPYTSTKTRAYIHKAKTEFNRWPDEETKNAPDHRQ